ncbi:MAG: InlB B-repeat-containing protein, partial [Fibromonadales bacterium]|nr:InlB B-repeat-containing protein [Fibromonadales bacterium]
SLVRVNGGALTMNGGEIIDNNNIGIMLSGSGVVVNSGVFTMNNGEISGNLAQSGGGVIVSGGTFNMINGIISNNAASGSGGGVRITSGTFTMSGGSINSNTANNLTGGGGVAFVSGTFVAGGTAKIFNNTHASFNISPNVYLANGTYITISTETPPASGMNISVSTETASGVIVESGASPSDAQYFYADQAGKTVGYIDGTLQIVSTTYTVTYHGNDNTGGTALIDNVPYISGARAELLGAGNLSKTGYYFKIWNSQEDGLGDDYSEGDEIQIDDNTELYAIWEPKTQITKPALTQNEFTYNGEEKNAELDATNAAYTLSGNNATSVGSYKATVTLNNTIRTEWTDGTTEDLEFAWSIAKANPSYTTPTDLEATYGDQLSAITLPSGWTWEGTETVGNAGTQTHKATFTPTDIANYNTATGINITIAVAKANPIVPAAPANLTAEEGQKLAEIALPQNWHWMNETEYVGTPGEQTHQAKYVPADTENYNTMANIDLKITVSSELTPILHHVPYPMSHVPKYYTLKGISLGTAKPTAPGVYIVKIGTQTLKVVVR